MEIILILANSILVVGGIVGNILVRIQTLGDAILNPPTQVCLSVATTPSLQTVVNVFLVNLAVADIMVLSFCAPFSILQVLKFLIIESQCLLVDKLKLQNETLGVILSMYI